MFKDRKDAGKKLAEKINVGENFIILGIPRGGMVVANEVAKKFDVCLDVVISRRIPDSIDPEHAIGSVAPDRSYILDEDTVKKFGIKQEYLERMIRIESIEIDRRMMKYRGTRDNVDVKGKTVVVIDDGISTGYTMKAATRFLKKSGAAKVAVGVPVICSKVVKEFENECDDLVFVEAPEDFRDVEDFYEKFPQISDDEVLKILGK